MEFRHINHLRSYLESIDKIMEEYEMKLKLEGKSENVLKHIHELRKEISEFLSSLGISSEKKNIYNEIFSTCTFFESDIAEIEPKNFQKKYGKISEKEEKEIEKRIKKIRDKIEKIKTEAKKHT